MKKVLFLIPSFQIGGTNTSLYFLLKKLDTLYPNRNQYFVYALSPIGLHIEDLSKYACLINHSSVGKDTLSERIKKLINPFRKWIYKHIGCDLADFRLKKIASTLVNQYDVIISYQEVQCTKLLSFVKDSSKKVAWVHCEYSSLIKFSNGNVDSTVYNNMNRIVCVSEAAKLDFCNCLPKYADKVICLYNQIDQDDIRLKASSDLASIIDQDKSIVIVSVGRIDAIKRFSKIPEIISNLKITKTIKWYIIGSVAHESEWEELNRNITRFKCENAIEYLGAQSNPYPYIKHADMLVCLSSSESFSYVISEAKTLGVPVITTDYPCANEFVQDGIEGRICKLEEMSAVISECINNNSYLKYKSNLKDYVYPYSISEEILTKIYL